METSLEQGSLIDLTVEAEAVEATEVEDEVEGGSPSIKLLWNVFRCHKLGHYQYECPSWEKRVNYVELDEDEEMLLMSYVEMNGATREAVWFLDSGCSNHMSGDK